MKIPSSPTWGRKRHFGYDVDTHGLRHYQADGSLWLSKHPRALIGDEPRLGKAQDLDCKVLTPTGWKRMGDLRVGDKVVDPDGGTSRVTAVHRRGKLPRFKVTMSDGGVTYCSADHLWDVTTPNDRMRQQPRRVIPLSDMQGRLASKWMRQTGEGKGTGARKRWFAIPVAQPTVFAPGPKLPVAPYLLGVLLGDGCLRGHALYTCPDRHIHRRVDALLPPGVVTSRQVSDCPAFSLVGRRRGTNPMLAIMRSLGLLGHLSIDKFVPSMYLTASVRDRIDLLHGLMDTDGDCSITGRGKQPNRRSQTTTFNTSSPRLADDVTFLVRSLGGVVSRYTKKAPTYTYRGERRTGKPAYRLNIRLPFNPFTLPKKRDRWKVKLITRSFEKIERAGSAEMRCISVNTKRNLYITDDFIVTHNSAIALRALPPGAHCVILCPAIVQHNWSYEVKKWRPDLYATVGEKLRRPRKGEVLIGSYDSLPPASRGWTDKLIPEPMSDVYLILDEVHACKSADAARTRRVRLLQAQCQAVWGLSGTPLLGHPEDLWGVLVSCGVSQEFAGEQEFMSAFGETEGDTSVKPWLEARLKKVMLRRTREGVKVQLPRQQRTDIQVPAPADLKEHLNQLMLTPEWLMLGPDELPPFQLLSAARKALAKSRIPAAVEHATRLTEGWTPGDAGRPLVVFSTHREPVQAVVRGYAEGGTKVPGVPNSALILGDTTAQERASLVKDFMLGKLRVLALTMDAGGVGIDLSRADQVLCIDLDWTPGINQQAEDRVMAVGKTGMVEILRMVSDHPIDMRVLEILVRKQELIRNTVG